MNSQWKLVPVEPTETMVINGFESEPDECFSDEEVWEQYQGMSGCQQAAFRAKLCWAAMVGSAPAAPEADAKSVCDHAWTDDGEFLLVCTKCGTQENHDPKWRDMESAPKDGTLLRLLVAFDEHSTEDADEAPTIGANNFDNDGEDAWCFAGWCWTHDHFTQGVGTPVGWLPMIEASASTDKLDRVTAERDALQQRLNAADQRIDELEQDKARLDALDSNCWDVRFNSSPNGDAGDSSINIEVVGHWMDKPFERVIGENYSENLRAAIDQAMTAPAYPPARPEYPELEEALEVAAIQ